MVPQCAMLASHRPTSSAHPPTNLAELQVALRLMHEPARSGAAMRIATGVRPPWKLIAQPRPVGEHSAPRGARIHPRSGLFSSTPEKPDSSPPKPLRIVGDA